MEPVFRLLRSYDLSVFAVVLQSFLSITGKRIECFGVCSGFTLDLEMRIASFFIFQWSRWNKSCMRRVFAEIIVVSATRSALRFCSGDGIAIRVALVAYQRVSPDCLPLSNGRKPILRICKEDDADSGRIASCNGFDGKTHRFRPGSTPSSSQDHNFSQFLVSDSLQPENHTLAKSQINHESGSGGGDILLQWGQKKRSRGSRAESRAVADETPSQAKQTVKIHRRVVSGMEKRTTSAAMSPPSAVSSHNRTANHRPSMPVRETTAGSSLCRNLEERSNIGNGSQLGNGNGRVHSRSAEKRSAQSPEKMEKMTTSSAQGAEKQKGANVQAEPMNVESVPQSEPEAGVVAEKLNMDLFEWPRIYIALSRKEKEDDFLKMKGTKLPQRPKKRAKNVDKTLQYCFPGLWLSDLTRSRYEVREKKCVKKKRRGLKGMESMDSESE